MRKSRDFLHKSMRRQLQLLKFEEYRVSVLETNCFDGWNEGLNPGDAWVNDSPARPNLLLSKC